MKEIIEDKKTKITKCYDKELDKYYKFKDLVTGKLLNRLFLIKYSEDRFEITDIEADRNLIFKNM